MRTAGWVLVACLASAGCGDQLLGIPRGAEVSALEDEDALEVCDEFVAVFCRNAPPAPFEAFCDPCVQDELCAMAGVVGAMDAECSGVTVGQVRDCAEGRTAGLCAPASGGCMVEVAGSLCPSP